MKIEVHPLAGKPAPRSILVNTARLVSSYYTDAPSKKVSFGTSGHRGSSLNGAFNEPHIAAISQAVCDYRKINGIDGPLFLGFDTHALSVPAFRTALEVFAANDVHVVIHKNDEYTPTPVVSFSIVAHNKGRQAHFADGIVITSSHNPPTDGGFKYNPPSGGPADLDVTNMITTKANNLMDTGNKDVRRMPFEKALKAPNVHHQDIMTPFIAKLGEVVDMDAIKGAGLRIGVDPLGGAGVNFWEPIAQKYGLNITSANPDTDQTFGFMTLDSDGFIRMDCSSPYAMASLISLKDQYDIAGANDPDFDRHGIVDKNGLMNPNHFLSVAIWYLLQNRPNWPVNGKIGKTFVTTSMIDKIARQFNRQMFEVPVGFKWFVPGLLDGSLLIGMEESAGASMLDKNGHAFSTDKDGFSMVLLAAEIIARTGRMPSEIYSETLAPAFGAPFYRMQSFTLADKDAIAFKKIVSGLPTQYAVGTSVADRKVELSLTQARGNNAFNEGLFAQLEGGSWFAVRASGTEPKGKLYIESYGGEDEWDRIHLETYPRLLPK